MLVLRAVCFCLRYTGAEHQTGSAAAPLPCTRHMTPLFPSSYAAQTCRKRQPQQQQDRTSLRQHPQRTPLLLQEARASTLSQTLAENWARRILNIYCGLYLLNECSPCAGTVLLNLCTHKSPGDFLKMQTLISRSGVDPEILHF